MVCNTLHKEGGGGTTCHGLLYIVGLLCKHVRKRGTIAPIDLLEVTNIDVAGTSDMSGMVDCNELLAG